MLTFHFYLIKLKTYFQTTYEDAEISSSRRVINAANFSQQPLDWLVNALCLFLIEMQHITIIYLREYWLISLRNRRQVINHTYMI